MALKPGFGLEDLKLGHKFTACGGFGPAWPGLRRSGFDGLATWARSFATPFMPQSFDIVRLRIHRPNKISDRVHKVKGVVIWQSWKKGWKTVFVTCWPMGPGRDKFVRAYPNQLSKHLNTRLCDTIPIRLSSLTFSASQLLFRTPSPMLPSIFFNDPYSDKKDCGLKRGKKNRETSLER